MTAQDLDSSTTAAVRSSHVRNDKVGMKAAVEMRTAPTSGQNADNRAPRSDPNLQYNAETLLAVYDGRSDFFQIQVFDSCFEDGDIVQLLINGTDYSTVRLTNQGSTISIPMASGSTDITLKGIHDGGGGITVMFVTSQGHFFCRAMAVNEEYHLQVVVK